MRRLAARFGSAITLCLGLSLGISAVTRLGAHAFIPLAGRAPYTFPPGSLQVYRMTAGQNVLQLINPRSLADQSGSELHLGPHHAVKQTPAIAITADGSKLAVVYELPTRHWPIRAQDMTLQLFDARTGEPLSIRHHPAIPFSMTGISADGSVVYGFRAGIDLNQPCAPSSFYLLDARTGRVVRHLIIAAKPWDPIMVGPNLGRLYTMTSSDHINSCGPQNSYRPTILAYDLQTGKAVRTLQLKSALAGYWMTNWKVNGEPVAASWTPGVALSPDGSQLAVLDGHSNALTLLHARSLQVAGIETLSRPRAALQTLAALLGLAPDAAEAKGQENGVCLQMQYTADGRSLIVTGSRLRPDRRHLYASSQSLGIRLIDSAGGQIEAWLDDGKRTAGIWPAPDGSAIYSSVEGWTRQGGWQYTLRRHDPATLQVRARRTFLHMGNWWLNLFFLDHLSPLK
jgi:hypothetical protein